MSEPYSLFLHATIAEASIPRYLGTRVRSAREHVDFAKCTDFVDVEAFEGDTFDEWLESATRGATTYGAGLVGLRGAKEHPFFRFYYDRPSGSVTIAVYLYAQGALELVHAIALLRGIADVMAVGETGFVAVHDPFFGNGTVGVLALEGGTSRVLERNEYGKARLAAIDAVVGELRTNAAPYLASLEAGEDASEEATARSTRDELHAFL